MTTLHLVSSYCRLHLLYATECSSLSVTQRSSLQHAWQCAVSHIFNVRGADVNFICSTTEECTLGVNIVNRNRIFLHNLFKLHDKHSGCTVVLAVIMVTTVLIGNGQFWTNPQHIHTGRQIQCALLSENTYVHQNALPSIDLLCGTSCQLNFGVRTNQSRYSLRTQIASDVILSITVGASHILSVLIFGLSI